MREIFKFYQVCSGAKLLINWLIGWLIGTVKSDRQFCYTIQTFSNFHISDNNGKYTPTNATNAQFVNHHSLWTSGDIIKGYMKHVTQRKVAGLQTFNTPYTWVCFSLFTFTVLNSCFKFYMNMNINMNYKVQVNIHWPADKIANKLWGKIVRVRILD